MMLEYNVTAKFRQICALLSPNHTSRSILSSIDLKVNGNVAEI